MLHRNQILLSILFIFILSQIVFIISLIPDIGWGDSPELITTGYTLGVSHPTGYPLYTLLNHLVGQLGPGESAAYRMNYLSALSSSVAMILLFLLLYRYLLVFISSHKLALFISGTGSLLFGFSSIFWSQSITAEVYSFEIVIMLGIFLSLFEWMKTNNKGFLLLVFFLLGIGFSHHLMTIIFVPVLFYILYANRKNETLDFKIILLGISLFITGLVGLLYLPIRAAGYPYMNWGNVQNFTALIDMLTGGQFKLRMISTQPGMGIPGQGEYITLFYININQFFDSIINQFVQVQEYLGIIGIWIFVLINLILLIFMIIGLLQLWIRVRQIFWIGIIVFISVLLVITNYRIRDIYPYYLPAILILSLWVTIGLGWVLNQLVKLYPHQKILPGILLLFFGCLSLASNYQDIIRYKNKTAFYYGKNILDSVEENALIITGGDNDIFPLWYWKYVRGIKPGVEIFGGNFLTSPWYDSFFHSSSKNLRYTLSSTLFQSQAEWANALVKQIIFPNEIERPVYSTFYDPFIARERYYLPLGNFLPDLMRIPDYELLPRGYLYQLNKLLPDFSVDTNQVRYQNTVVFNDNLTLLGHDMGPSSIFHCGDVFSITFYWMVENKSLLDYSILILYPDKAGMVDMENNKPYFTQELRPIQNVFPIPQWENGRIYRDSYKVMIPLLISPGEYSMAISARTQNQFAYVKDQNGNTLPQSIQIHSIKILE